MPLAESFLPTLDRRRRKRPKPRPRSTPNVTPDTLLAQKDPRYHKRVARQARAPRGAASEILTRFGDRQAQVVPSDLVERLARLRTAYSLSQNTLPSLKSKTEREQEKRLRRRIETLGRRIERQVVPEAKSGLAIFGDAAEEVVEKGVIGAPFYAITGTDISADARKAIYGTENPTLKDIAINAAIPPALKGAGMALRTGRAGVAAAGASRAASAVKGASSAARGATTGRAATALSRSRGGRAALTTGRAAKGTAKIAAKTATFPIRRPIKTAKYSFYAQAPLAVSTGDPAGEFQKVLEGKGIAATALGDAGRFVAEAAPGEVGANIVKDAFDLPAQVVPSIYMPLAGLVEAARGDSSRLEGLWNDYKEIGLLPAVLEGDFGKALENAKAHPLFLALEARGAQAVTGRVAGAAARRAGLKIGSQKRAPLELPGGLAAKPRSYSPDLIEKGIQVALDKRRARKRGGQKASLRETERTLRERVDRIVASEEGARRAGRSAEAEGALRSLASGSRIPGRRRISKVDQSGVNLAVQGFIRSPDTFALDLGKMRLDLDAAHKRMGEELASATTKEASIPLKARMDANRELAKRVDRLLSEGNPETIFNAARQNVGALRDIDQELTDLGLLDPRQAAQARSMPAAMRHLDARYGLSNETKQAIAEIKQRIARSENETEKASLRGSLASLSARKQLVDRDGNALPPERVEAMLRERGAEPAGFVSQSPAARGARSFYRTFFPDRQTVGGQKRSGKATEEGTFDAGFEAVAEQRIRGRGIADAVKGFDRTVREFAVGGRRFKTYAEAREAARHPEAYDLPANIELQPVRLAPLRANAKETARAEELFDSLDPSNQTGMERITDSLLNEALRDGDGPVVLLPQQVVGRLREHLQAATTTRRVAQVLSSQFKGVVLPTSPNWMLGNLLDVSLRTMLAGTGPWGRNAAVGRKIFREMDALDPDTATRARSALAPGSVYGHADGTRTFRDARQFAGTSLAPLARALGTLRRAPGVKQAVNFYTKYRDTVFAFNERFIERQSQYALLGKAARSEVRQTTGKWHKGLKLGDEAVRDLAKGLRETPNQIKFAKSIEETLGQWTANSPAARAFLVDYAPFAMWTRAATRFVFWTLPVKHPIKTAIGAIAYEMTQEEREALGLSHFAERPVPPNLQGSIPIDGKLLAPQSLTTFGYFADYQQSLSSMLLPQFPLTELAGLDFTGSKLTHEDGTPLNVAERANVALLSMGEAYLPFFAMGKRIADDGPEAALPRSMKPYDAGLVDWLRDQSQSRTITVPAKPASSSESDGIDYGSVFGGNTGTQIDYTKVFGGG